MLLRNALEEKRINQTWSESPRLIEANSSQKVWSAKVRSGDQGGEPTLGHCPSVTEFEMKLKFFKKVIKFLIML